MHFGNKYSNSLNEFNVFFNRFYNTTSEKIEYVMKMRIVVKFQSAKKKTECPKFSSYSLIEINVFHLSVWHKGSTGKLVDSAVVLVSLWVLDLFCVYVNFIE